MMTPRQKIMTTILLEAIDDGVVVFDKDAINENNIGLLYEELLIEKDLHWDYESEFREGQDRTDITPKWSNHYESYSVASEMFDGSWVGWTYFYGGGKHGDPESIDWVSEAYNVTFTESTRTIVVRHYTRDEQ
jgi:hypothetical protein